MAVPSSTGIALLRIRQSDIKHVGPTEERIKKIATFLAPEEHNNLDDDFRNFLFRPDLIETDTVAERLLERIVSLLGQARTLFIDICIHPRHTDNARLARVLINALRASSNSIEAHHRIVVFTHGLPHIQDTLRDSVKLVRWRHQLLFAGATGRTASDPDRTWTPPPGLDDVVKTTFTDWQKAFSAKVIRRRGVFMDDGPRPPKTFSAFRYNAERANYELQQMLELYIEHHKVQTVVWDARYPQWLREVFLSATTSIPGTDHIELNVADPSATADSKLVKDRRVLVVAPMYRSGGTLDSLADRVSDSAALRLLAVLAKQPKTARPARMAEGVIRRSTRPSIDYFLGVEHEPVNTASWQMRVAERLHEVHDPNDDNPVALVGLWALFAKYGAGREHPAPKHAPIAHFPALGTLDDWDALWLAESLVASAEKATALKRSELLVVIPDEEDAANGSERIRDALAKKLGVSVAPILRSDIGKPDAVPDHLEDLVRDYASDNRIVLMDESVVNFTTFRALTELLSTDFGATEIKSFSVLDASHGAEPVPEFESFYSWTPRRFEEAAS